MKTGPWLIIVAVLVGIILLQRACNGSKCPEAVVKTDTQWIAVHDTITKEKLIPITKVVEHRPAPVTVTDTVFLTEIQHVDTVEILKDYFATRNYSDTNHLEGFGSFIINDAITQNKIKGREIIYDLKFPEITKTVIERKNQWYGGIDVGGTKSWISFGPQLQLINKKDQEYHLGASYTTENLFYFHLGTSWKIKF